MGRMGGIVISKIKPFSRVGSKVKASPGVVSKWKPSPGVVFKSETLHIEIPNRFNTYKFMSFLYSCLYATDLFLYYKICMRKVMWQLDADIRTWGDEFQVNSFLEVVSKVKPSPGGLYRKFKPPKMKSPWLLWDTQRHLFFPDFILTSIT